MIKIRFIIIFFLLTSISLNTFSQDDIFAWYVIAQPNLTLREKPDINSNVIGTLAFGEKVKFDNHSVKDIVNQIENRWLKVSYKEKQGYVWGLYLLQTVFNKEKDYNHEYRIMLEAGQCSYVNFSDSLNWYGLYETDNDSIHELKRVSLNIVFQQTANEEEKEKYFGNDEGAEYSVITDNDKQSILLIGSKKKLEERKLKGINLGIRYSNKPKKPIFLLPEEVAELSVGKDKLFVKAKVEAFIKDSVNYIIEKQYQLEVTDKSLNYWWLPKDNYIQNLTSGISHMTSRIYIHAFYKNPKIVWYGDLDGDNKIDILFKSTLMAEGGGADSHLILFLSSEADDNSYLKKVAHYVFWSCYG